LETTSAIVDLDCLTQLTATSLLHRVGRCCCAVLAHFNNSGRCGIHLSAVSAVAPFRPLRYSPSRRFGRCDVYLHPMKRHQMSSLCTLGWSKNPNLTQVSLHNPNFILPLTTNVSANFYCYWSLFRGRSSWG